MEKITILHVLFVSDNKSSGVRNIVPKHLEYQASFANVALLNCNYTELEEAKGKYNVYKLGELQDKKISNLPKPYNKPDLVIFHAIYYPQYLRLYKECKKNNIPYIIVPHGSLTKKAQKQKWLKKIPANLLLFNRYINNASAIQFLIEGEKDNSRKCKRYIISGNGIDTTSLKEKIYNNCNNDSQFKIIYIGRYDTKTKGLDLLMNAMGLIKEYARKNNIILAMYGTDYRGRKKEIESLIKHLKIDDIVKINGPIWEGEKNRKLCEADIFIQPSRTEGQPVGLMEAIDVGIPCIVTKETNYGEIIQKGDMGWCAETNAESIAEKIKDAFENRANLYKMSEKEKKYAQEEFEWNKIAREAIKKYKNTIKEYKEEQL